MIPLRLENLTKRFGPVTAVDDVSLSVEPGELFFLLGPSGCGKTTLLRLIAGFYRPDAGRIHFGERDVTDLAPHRRRCGMVFQNYALWPHMTVRDNVAFGLAVQGLGRTERRRRAMDLLDVVQMSDYAARRPTQLSGGQQQRVALARALAIQPDFLLLDEPLSNLDAKLRLQMRSEIRRTQRAARVTSVYVTHDQDEALALADRLAVVRDGRIVALGTPRDLYENPPGPWVASFLGATNLVEGEVRAREGESALVRTAFGLVAAARAPRAIFPGAAVLASIRPEAARLLAREGEVPAANVFEATVLARTFQGDTEQVRLRLGGLEILVSDRPTDLAPAGPGETVRVHFPPQAIRLFAREREHVAAASLGKQAGEEA
ncbi:MAG TPA: ABC transporter ATP-binding protein [Phycisphaerae bacterium]|nr:ABC transporter ATP-binding protein [Phycisphaerae bacterium]